MHISIIDLDTGSLRLFDSVVGLGLLVRLFYYGVSIAIVYLYLTINQFSYCIALILVLLIICYYILRVHSSGPLRVPPQYIEQ